MTFAQFVGAIVQNVLTPLIWLVTALALLYFLWGALQLITADGEEKHKEAIKKITYGLVGLAVIVGVWGLVNIILSTFRLNYNPPSLNSFSSPSNTGGGGTNWGTTPGGYQGNGTSPGESTPY